ncbi:MAG: ABC transporter permease [Chloroflexota bacterium]|nr:ABC transporter permease [Chloroflexota bacterium]MDE2897226.1 ABC transporter permease [Chloroflexota bacterium]
MNASGALVRAEFRALLALARKGWRIDRRQPYFLTSGLLGTMQWVLPIVLATIALAGPNDEGLRRFADLAGTDAYIAYSVTGAIAFLYAGWMLSALSFDLRLNRNLGTLPTLWTSAVSRAVLTGGGALGHALAPAVMAVAAFGGAWALFRFPLEANVGPALAVMVGGALAMLGLALPLAAVTLRYREAHYLVSLFVSGTGILAGIAYPIAVLPDWAQWVSRLLPPTWLLHGLRQALVFGDVGDAMRSCGLLLVMALVYGTAGLVLLKVMDAAARAKGELEWM